MEVLVKVTKGLKKLYKNLSWYNRMRLLEANYKTPRKNPKPLKDGE
jgi:hypothetical protein